jgi:hypothetical protein
MAMPLMGIVGGGMELAKMGGEALRSAPQAPKTSLEALGRLGQGAWRGISGEVLGQGIGKGISALIPSRQVAAQGIRVATGVPEREAAAVLKDPGILSRAKSTQEAGKLYQEALSKAPYKIESAGAGSRVAFNKTMLSPEAALNKFDEIAGAMDSGALDLQSAVSMRQTLSHHIGTGKGDWYVQPMREQLGAIDNYIEGRLADFPDAVKAYREAKIAEEFSSWLPLNKNLSPNVLRTAGALGYAAHGASRGELLPSVMALGVSPKMWGYGIRAGSAVAPAVEMGTEIGARAAGQGAAKSFFPSSTEELMRKYYEEQR